MGNAVERIVSRTEWNVLDTSGLLTEKQLISCLKDAYSIESHALYGKEALDAEYIGVVTPAGNLYRRYILYKLDDGTLWYETKIAREREFVTIHEHIFGYPEEMTIPFLFSGSD